VKQRGEEGEEGRKRRKNRRRGGQRENGGRRWFGHMSQAQVKLGVEVGRKILVTSPFLLALHTSLEERGE